MPPAVSGDQDWSYTEGRKAKQNEKISVSQALRDIWKQFQFHPPLQTYFLLETKF